MKRVFLLLVAVATVVTASASDVLNFVEVSGKSEVKVTPNEFVLAITIDEQATKGRYTVEEVEKSMIAALAKIGIKQDALTMSGMSSFAVRRKDALTTASYELNLTSMKQLAACYESLENLGITNIRISKATNSDMERYRTEARVMAVKDAQQRAQQIGEALNQRVGACFEVTDRSSYTNEAVYVGFSQTRSTVANDVAADPVEFRDITITYNINAKFLLELSGDQQEMIVN
ncbi:MAG: SIMPL domain-containing protein [Rikenellaceae bacterium]